MSEPDNTLSLVTLPYIIYQNTNIPSHPPIKTMPYMWEWVHFGYFDAMVGVAPHICRLLKLLCKSHFKFAKILKLLCKDRFTFAEYCRCCVSSDHADQTWLVSKLLFSLPLTAKWIFTVMITCVFLWCLDNIKYMMVWFPIWVCGSILVCGAISLSNSENTVNMNTRSKVIVELHYLVQVN